MIEPGQTWARDVPMCVSPWRDPPEPDDDIRWKPGRRCVADGPDYGRWEDDGIGEERRTIVAVVPLPKPYTARVIFLREWIAPDGRMFGSRRLRCIGIAAFTRWRNRNARRISE